MTTEVTVEDAGSETEETVEEITDTLEEVVDTLTDTLEDVVEELTDTIEEVVEGGGETEVELHERVALLEERLSSLPMSPSYSEVSDMIDSRLAPVVAEVEEVVEDILEEVEDEGGGEEITIVSPDVEDDHEDRPVLSKFHPSRWW